MENNRNSLKGKKVVILGGTSGLGLATAKEASQEGANVIIVSSNQNRINDALKQLSTESTGFVVDLSKVENIKNLFENIGNFDHLVYSAGENLNLTTLDGTDIENAKNFFTIRYWGALAAVKYASKYINEGGSIGLMSGIASQRPGSGWALAASICGAMDGLCRALAVELAPIRVNAVAPGVIKTNLWNSMDESTREGFYKSVGDSLLVKRVGNPEEIAQTFTFLMKQTFATGQIITIDGGTVLV
ncbi:SDR family oxidoreductase [Flavobacterium defluvii]|uniref:NAD(P)-dependent dehydrogenase, short-chain alcohol dehydrogenase family n=1 Tax=Flavobacterium defluvii TaxID=370979 RepID=A0A1M5NAL4_9FLAO|nr:SDR family oxidoreductase [Flavobacterium defluvii]SHG86502.1 NAD(P)-dependent dehydrogenase, short-chain alcohol dehydrogenase family [Flavobacterium defluvii]